MFPKNPYFPTSFPAAPAATNKGTRCRYADAFQSGRSVFPMNQQFVSFFNILGFDSSSQANRQTVRNRPT
jgi:hypothetical protein